MLPDEGNHVLLFDDTEGAVIGYYLPPNHFIQCTDGLKLKKVSHWMLIPEPPHWC